MKGGKINIENIIKQKKGIPLGQAFGAVLTLVLIGVLVIISLVIFNSMNTATVTSAGTTVTNESSFLNSSGDVLNNNVNNVLGYSNPTILIAINGSSGAVIQPANYTVSGVGLFQNSSTSPIVWANVNVTYSYSATVQTAASNSSTVFISQFSTYPALIGLVGTIIFLGIVIGVLVASFAFGGRRDGGA